MGPHEYLKYLYSKGCHLINEEAIGKENNFTNYTSNRGLVFRKKPKTLWSLINK